MYDSRRDSVGCRGASRGRTGLSTKLAALVLALLLVAEAGDTASQTPVTTDSAAGLMGPSTLPTAQAAYLVTLTRSTLNGLYGIEGPLPGDKPEGMGSAFERLRVQLRVGTRLRGSHWGRGPDLLSAVRDGISQAAADSDYGGPLMAVEVPHARIELLIQRSRVPMVARDEESLERQFALGGHGVEIKVGDKGRSYRPTSAIINEIGSHRRLLEKLCAKIDLPADAWRLPGTELWRTDWVHLVESSSAPDGVFQLWRSRPIRNPAITRAELNRAMGAAADHLVRLQQANGSYYYLYDPIDDQFPADKLNLIRIAGTAYSVARFAGFQTDASQKKRYTDSARRCLDFLLTFRRPMPQFKDGAFIIEAPDGKGKLGCSALTLLLLEQEVFLKEEFDDLRNDIIDGILAQQNHDGSFASYVLDRGDLGNQDYYPGEALLALLLDYQRTGNKKIKVAIERAFPYYVEHFSKNPTTAFVLWQVGTWRGYYDLHAVQKYADFVFQQIDWLLQWQYIPQNSTCADYIGGFTVGSKPGISTSTYVEAIIMAFDLARKLGDTERAARYKGAAIEGLQFLLRLEITEDTAFFLPNPTLAVGGFTKNISSFETRCDNDQHVVTCFITALDTPQLLQE